MSEGKVLQTCFKSKNVVSSSRPLELLHIDLFGPVKTASVRGKKYGLVIVDDYSRWTWVKFLKHKDESHSVFLEFCTQIQSEKEWKIIKVRSDHGGEFENRFFEEFFKKMVLPMISLAPELHSKMELLNERIRLCKKWPEP